MTASPEIETLAAQALELVRNAGRASVSNFRRKFEICYDQAVQVWEILESRGQPGDGN